MLEGRRYPQHIYSGEVIAQISGDMVQLASGTGPIVATVDISGVVVSVSGATVISKVSGQPVGVSGETIIAKTSGQVAKVSGETVVLASGPFVRSMISGDQIIAKISGETVTIGGISISGQPVGVSGETMIAKTSGQVAKVSGETVVVASGHYGRARVSGDTVVVASGAFVRAKMSGETVIAETSGQRHEVHIMSGAGIAVAISGNWVEAHITSGEVTVGALPIVGSAQVHILSGQVIAKTSGERHEVHIMSGAGIAVSVSGNWVEAHMLSGSIAVSASGNIVAVDGVLYTQKIEYDANNNAIVVGWAAPGSSISASVWRLQQITYTSGNPTDLQWCSGNTDFAGAWHLRSGYTYS